MDRVAQNQAIINLMQAGGEDKKIPSGDKIANLEQELRRDEIKKDDGVQSQMNNNAETPTPEQAALQKAFAPQDVNVNNQPNPLADYSRLVQQQRNLGGLQQGLVRSMLVTTMEGQTSAQKISQRDDPGFDMLAATFGLSQKSDKTYKKQKKEKKMDWQQYL